MTSSVTIPAEVVEKDSKLESSATRASESLAKHRWHNTLNPTGPQYSLRSYAKAVGRNVATISKNAHGYQAWIEGVKNGDNKTLADHMELAAMSSEKAAVAEVVAEVEGVSVHTVSKRRGVSDSLANITEQAKDRAQRKGTTVVEEAKDIATRRRQTRESTQRRQQESKSRKGLRIIEIEGDLANAQRRLTHALQVAQGLDLSDDEMELLRDSLAKIRSLLDLLDLRMAGTPDIDWDAELAKLGGVQ